MTQFFYAFVIRNATQIYLRKPYWRRLMGAYNETSLALIFNHYEKLHDVRYETKPASISVEEKNQLALIGFLFQYIWDKVN